MNHQHQPTRRSAIGAIAGVVGLAFASGQKAHASNLPAKTPRFTREEIAQVKERVIEEMDALPDGKEHPEAHHAVVALYAALDAADALRLRHDNATPGKFACACPFCPEIEEQSFVLEQYANALSGNVVRSGLIERAKQRYEKQCAARRRGVLTAVSKPLVGTAECPYRIEDAEVLHMLLAERAFLFHSEGLRERHQLEEDGDCPCGLCQYTREEIHVVRYFVDWLDGYAGGDHEELAQERQHAVARAERRAQVEAAVKAGRRTRKVAGGEEW